MRTQLYEAMFLVDNDSVRSNWKQTKSLVTDLVEKHSGQVETARRWDERRLAYPIERRLRGTYFLVHFTMDTQAVTTLRRDLELSETVLRYLLKAIETVPESERSLHQAELADDYVVPPPPEEDAPDPEPEPPSERGDARDAKDAKDGKDEKDTKDAKPADGAAPKEDEAPVAAATETKEG